MAAHIAAVVAAYYDVSPRDITSDRKSRAVSRARQVAMYLAYELTPKSLPEIGARFSRDHTTVIYAIRAVQKRMIDDAEVAEDVRILRERLAG
jgi:chromosomal replication initiator protein